MLITGASRGIGKAIADLFAKNGYEAVCPTREELNLNDIDSIKSFVCQGFTLTDLTYKNNTDEQVAAISESIPLGRMAVPEEIAKAVFF